MPAANGNGTNTKAFGAVVGLVAVVAGVYAMVEPMGQQLEYMQEQLSTINAQMSHDDARERVDAAETAQQSERFKEVETQFRALTERHNVDIATLDRLAIMRRAHDKADHEAIRAESRYKLAELLRRLSVLEQSLSNSKG